MLPQQTSLRSLLTLNLKTIQADGGRTAGHVAGAATAASSRSTQDSPDVQELTRKLEEVSPHPTPYTLHPAPYTLKLTTYTPRPASHTLHPIPSTLRLEPNTLHLKTIQDDGGRTARHVAGAATAASSRSTQDSPDVQELRRNLEEVTPHPTPYTLHPAPFTLNLTPYTPHPTPCILHPTSYTFHPAP